MATHTIVAQSRGGWLPRTTGFSGLTPAQRASATAILDKVERLLRQVPELANPDGFEIRPGIGGGPRQADPDGNPIPGSIAEYGIGLQFFYPSRAVAGEGCTCINVIINQRTNGNIRDEHGRAFYIEGDRAKAPIGTQREIDGTLWDIPSATQVYGELWDFSRDIREGRGERSILSATYVGAGELPWKPVSREEYYGAVRLERNGKGGERQAQVQSVLSKTPYEQWMAEAPERNKARQESLDAARQTMSAEQFAEFKRKLEDTDRQVTEQLRKQHADDQERNRANLARSQQLDDAFSRELEAMTPEERRMPAWINNALTDGPIATGNRMTSDPAPPAWRVLTPNYDFYRARRSPVEVRRVDISISITRTGLQPKVRTALLQTFRKLDWAAFNQLLDSPR